ncbi:hypothetical protein EVAR_91542_1 [Eumeta japonica]|uniref:Histone-lysine N-methyltransferase SETMAR n=1 Tax=Eumeta variegata TaxID=151549 RepID=A0A4C1VBT6_EUMVA|nr:hypothetical protein EVAR_91542_1 [Eumeta japonica]
MQRFDDGDSDAVYDMVIKLDLLLRCRNQKQSVQWVLPFEKLSTKLKRSRSFGKKMVAFLFGMTGTLTIEILTRPPYSPDLAACDLYLFPQIKDKFRGKWFTDTEKAVAAYKKAVEVTPKWFH